MIPTWESVHQVAYVVSNGAATLNHYSAPVEVNPTHTRALLMLCALAVLLSIDVLAMALRRPPLIALPLLVTLSVPVSILQRRAGTAGLRRHGAAVPAASRDRAPRPVRGWAGGGDHRTGLGSVLLAEPWAELSAELWAARALTLWQVSIGAVLVALLLAPLVPVADLLDRDAGGGGGNPVRAAASSSRRSTRSSGCAATWWR